MHIRMHMCLVTPWHKYHHAGAIHNNDYPLFHVYSLLLTIILPQIILQKEGLAIPVININRGMNF